MKKKTEHIIAWVSSITNHLGYGSMSFALDVMKSICNDADLKFPPLVHAAVSPVQLGILQSLSERGNSDMIDYIKKLRNKM